MTIVSDTLDLLNNYYNIMLDCVSARVHGNIGIMVDPDFYAVQYRDAKVAYDTALAFLKTKVN